MNLHHNYAILSGAGSVLHYPYIKKLSSFTAAYTCARLLSKSSACHVTRYEILRARPDQGIFCEDAVGVRDDLSKHYEDLSGFLNFPSSVSSISLMALSIIVWPGRWLMARTPPGQRSTGGNFLRLVLKFGPKLGRTLQLR